MFLDAAQRAISDYLKTSCDVSSRMASLGVEIRKLDFLNTSKHDKHSDVLFSFTLKEVILRSVRYKREINWVVSESSHQILFNCLKKKMPFTVWLELVSWTGGPRLVTYSHSDFMGNVFHFHAAGCVRWGSMWRSASARTFALFILKVILRDYVIFGVSSMQWELPKECDFFCVDGM
jgi:hypothetical protein